MKTAKLTIGFLIVIVHGFFVCPSPLNYSENKDVAASGETLSHSTPHVSFQCILGFVVDNSSHKCKLVWNLAGIAKSNQTLTVLCPPDYKFDIESKSCVLQPQASIEIGTSNNDQNDVTCPAHFTFDVESKSCVLNTAPTKIIDVPIVCPAGSQFDGRSKCRKEW